MCGCNKNRNVGFTQRIGNQPRNFNLVRTEKPERPPASIVEGMGMVQLPPPSNPIDKRRVQKLRDDAIKKSLGRIR